MRVSRRSMLAGTAAGVLAPAVGLAATAGTASAAGLTRRITIYAEALPNGLYGYGLEPGKATIPGPLLEIYEGDTLEIELVNTTDQRLSIHPHGVNYDTGSDGAPLNASFNKPYETRTYTWKTRARYDTGSGFWMPGNAGYWHYHDHAMGTDHGTGGLARGLYGGLIVRKRG
ncbi:MAG TPA: multicopper oxidase domain-containing protein, partial [Amycolatopsis sp.]|uniref:multicopper oxidase domain-containing protein n=1 Tax=Amycolatopsis sp. TaxID=37632 RepID=UPI002F404A88